MHHRCRWHRWQMEKIFNQKIFYYFFWTPLGSAVSKFFKLILSCQQFDTVIVPIICHRCRWYRWCTLTCEYLRKISKKFATVFTEYSETGGKLIHEKNQKLKISWHCPFKGTVSRDFRLLVFFMNQFPPIPWVYHEGRFEFFRKFSEMFAAKGLPPVSTTPVANAKNLQS